MNGPIDTILMAVCGHAIGSAVINNKVSAKSLFDAGNGEVFAIGIDGVAGEVKIMLFIAGVILCLGGPELGDCAIICKDMSHGSAL